MDERIIAAIIDGVKKHDEVIVKRVGGKLQVVAVDRKVICREKTE